MQLKMIGVVAALVAAQHAAAALTSQSITDALDVITDYSMNATTVLESATPSNHEDAIEKGMSEMRKLYVEVKESTAKMGREPPAEGFSKSLQTDLCDTFRDCVEIEMRLLEAVIDKRTLIAKTSFLEPVRDFLGQFQGAVDTLASSIIRVLPTCQDGAKSDYEKLQKTLAEAVKAYGQIRRPAKEGKEDEKGDKKGKKGKKEKEKKEKKE
ncbi:hypothetical protein N3K66_008879 [Trichothecium roseum]|uniref:Uncharacterized protein n=1 Tax=Trichothecium roseum TaxID=47278 RepID=A0ACC0URY7_9HYPO|nr:hypothetical protein N3K66_008879 [Trichothecium roseum]